jgi:hypothetical protein
MRICTEGRTRITILVGSIAIKIPRVRFPNIFRHVRMIAGNDRSASEKIEKYTTKRSIPKALIRYLLTNSVPGLLANRQEHEFWHSHPEWPIAPILGMYLHGCILIMARGDPVQQDKCNALCTKYPGADLQHPYHVCMVRGQLKYVDYGHPDAYLYLNRA